MKRQAVVVFIDASDPLEAESFIGCLLEANEDARERGYYVHGLHDPKMGGWL